MMIAPHPDDESLAAGLLIQQAIAAGASVRVIYATDGDNNPWPQRLLERRWRLTDEDRARWGKRRRKEAIAALSALGLSGSDARFLGLPDQGLTALLLEDAANPVARIRQMIVDWSPTHLLVPSILDAHPDHSALAILAQFAVADLPTRLTRESMFCCVVHGDHKEGPFQIVVAPSNALETSIKAQAIAQHHTQVKLSRRRFMAYARRTEGFHLIDQAQGVAMGSIRSSRRTSTELALQVPSRLLTAQEGLVYLSGYGHDGLPVSACRRLSESNLGARNQGRTFRRVALPSPRPGSGMAELIFPTTEFDPNRSLFAKVRQGRWFFDHGWIELPSLPPAKIAGPRPSGLTAAPPPAREEVTALTQVSPAGFNFTPPASGALEERK